MGRLLSGCFTGLLLTLGAICLRAQTPVAGSFSNLRYKAIASPGDSVVVDSLSIVPGSFAIEGVADSIYQFYPERSLLVWKQKPDADSLHIRYRVFPLSFHHVFSHKSPRLADSGFVSLVYRPEEGDGSFLHFNPLEYTGSYGRSISVGNNQDIALNSSFNFQANGYIMDSIRLEAAITDNTIPFQPEGNTQRLQEFDQVYIRLMKNRHFLQLGDYSLESPPGYFLKFYKRLQGAYYQTASDPGKHPVNKLGLSGSVAKGQFARNIFQGLEGNQGPYKLTGNNGEQFFIVLAGTERVYVDNLPMERGENADYVINYNTAEIRFMPRKMITKDSRIQVEFEYQDRNFLNSLIYAWDELQIGRKWDVRLTAYSSQDAKNQPYLQQLDGQQKRFLEEIGDSIQNAFYPNIAGDTFASDKILYKLIDTTVGGVLFDSVFVYSTSPDSARYALAFSFVGEKKGDYIISARNANGRVYDWVAPAGGQSQGNYAPVQLLVTPKKQQVFVLNSNYRIDSLKNLNVEVSASNTDPNLFSKKSNETHWGLATRAQYTETRVFGTKDSLGGSKWNWQNKISYEFVQDRFKAIAPYRNVEFGRDWNVALAEVKPDEHLLYLNTALANKRLGTAAYGFSYYRRGADYEGYRNLLTYEYAWRRVRAGLVGNLLQARDTFQHSRFLRPAVFAEYNLKGLMNTYIGGRYEAEHNEIRKTGTDTLLSTAFSFDIATAYIRTSDQQPARWSLSYFSRRDKRPLQGQFRQQSHSHNAELRLGLSQWKNHVIGFTGTYRKLVVDDTLSGNLKPEETLLGRLEYTGSIFHNAIGWNTLYEFGSGQEQKISYTFVEVPAGQGVYTWIDYNADGVRQANEFELAVYPDQKKFIRVFTPSNEYVKVNYVNYNASLSLEPSAFWDGQEKKPWQRFISRFSSETSLQISNRLLASQGLKAYNPFVAALEDTSIILTNSSLSNSIYFNRASARWGIDYNLLYNAGKQLLIYGLEGSSSSQHLGKLRWNITRALSLSLAGRTGVRAYRSALNDSRSYNVRNWSGEPAITWLYRSVLRVTGGLKYERKANDVRYGGESATIKGLNLELRYSRAATGVIQLRGVYSGIDYSGAVSVPAAFVMLDALQPGNNYLWFMTWERRVGKGIELSLEYEGRKPGSGAVIHTGRMSIRAIL